MVITSTTKAELLALIQAIKEALFVNRLLIELGIKLNNSRIILEYNNK